MLQRRVLAGTSSPADTCAECSCGAQPAANKAANNSTATQASVPPWASSGRAQLHDGHKTSRAATACREDALYHLVGSLQEAPPLWPRLQQLPTSCSAHSCWTSHHHTAQSRCSRGQPEVQHKSRHTITMCVNKVTAQAKPQVHTGCLPVVLCCSHAHQQVVAGGPESYGCAGNSHHSHAADGA